MESKQFSQLDVADGRWNAVFGESDAFELQPFTHEDELVTEDERNEAFLVKPGAFDANSLERC